MRAIRYHAYGGSPAIERVPVPEIDPEEILVRVEAAAVNPLDIKLLSGSMQWYFDLKLPYTMGSDFAGTIERVGANVRARRPGERVIARRPPLLGGAFADFAVVPQDDCVALPSSMSVISGAGIPTAAGTAWSALFDVAKIGAGDSILIHAGAGGVGSFAVQFAKLAGAHVIATASGEGVEIVERLGADEVIDYRRRDFAKEASGVDVVLDTVGFETQLKSFDALKRGGHLVSVAMQPDPEVARARGVMASRVYYKLEPGGLEMLVGLIARNSIQILLDREVPFPSFAGALERQASGRARGKIVLKDFDTRSPS